MVKLYNNDMWDISTLANSKCVDFPNKELEKREGPAVMIICCSYRGQEFVLCKDNHLQLQLQGTH